MVADVLRGTASAAPALQGFWATALGFEPPTDDGDGLPAGGQGPGSRPEEPDTEEPDTEEPGAGGGARVALVALEWR